MPRGPLHLLGTPTLPPRQRDESDVREIFAAIFTCEMRVTRHQFPGAGSAPTGIASRPPIFN